MQPRGGRAELHPRQPALAAAALKVPAGRLRLAPFDARRHDDPAVVALVMLRPPAETLRGARVEVDGPARLGVDAADGDVDVRAGRVGLGGADRVVAVVEADALQGAADGRQHVLLRRGLGPRRPAQHEVRVRLPQTGALGR